MDKIFGEARGQLIQNNEEERLVDSTADQNLDLVNRYTQKPLTREEVNIKSMWLCNDIIDSYYSRFNEKTLNELAEKIPGGPVMIGHNTEMLPIGRFFKAQVVRREDSHLWLRAWFYWPKDMDHSADMLSGIESGLYREVSVSWSMTAAICSICGKDMRSMECPHIPGRKYPDANGTDQLCFWESEGIKDFYEGSLVYKGGQYGTSIDEERKKIMAERSAILDKKMTDIHAEVRNKSEDISFKDLPEGKYNICPNYDCHAVRIEGNKVFINDEDVSLRLHTIASELKDNKETYSGYVFRKRGNSRLHRDIFQKWFESKEVDDHTIFIKLFDNRTILKDTAHVQAIKFISPEAVSEGVARTVASKDGCIFFNDKERFIVKELSHDTQSKDNNKKVEVKKVVERKDPIVPKDTQAPNAVQEETVSNGIYRTWEGSRQYYQFQIDNRWYKTPTSVATSMIFKEVETLDVKRSMLLGEIETSIDCGVLTITSKLITGRYRVSNTTLNGQKLKVVKLITDNLQ